MRLDQFAMADILDFFNTLDYGLVGYVYLPAISDSPKAESAKGGAYTGSCHILTAEHMQPLATLR